jgi:ABC-type uncharacterized transport system permease subunit
MFPALEKTTLFCFFASYFVALILEVVQTGWSSRWGRWAAIAVATAGLLAHSAYLIVRSQKAGLPPLFASMHDWLLVLAWLGAAVYLVVQTVNPRMAVGIFVLPLVLVLVGSAYYVGSEHRPKDQLYGWGMFHATTLVLGIAGVIGSLVFSMMYLVQHRRLRHKAPEAEGQQLFSLEKLGRANWWSVVLSAPLLTIGLASGVWLTLMSQQTDRPIPLASAPFIICGLLWVALMILLAWLLGSHRPAGKQVAWRTIWSCGFLLTTLVILEVFSGIHHK